jgi:hypothetical protein
MTQKMACLDLPHLSLLAGVSDQATAFEFFSFAFIFFR